MLYVLPYGQMSLWGATVITNMLSAIPWIGQDFVQFVLILCLVLFVYSIFFSTPVDILPTIGTINTSALRGKAARTENDKLEFKSISYSFLAMFVGFVDGDGYIKVTRTTKGFISLELVISLDKRDKAVLEYFISVLRVGRLYDYKSTVKYIIGRVDLQEVIFPLLVHHEIFFLTKARRAQYALALYILANNIVRYDEVKSGVSNLNSYPLPATPEAYISLPFFTNWVVDFVMAEGSFHVKTSLELYFTVRQRSHENLFEAFQLLFYTRRSIDNTTLGHSKFSVSSVKDLNKVIMFFSFSNLHPLIGHKKVQYDAWINAMRNLLRFKEVKLPENTT